MTKSTHHTKVIMTTANMTTAIMTTATMTTATMTMATMTTTIAQIPHCPLLPAIMKIISIMKQQVKQPGKLDSSAPSR